MRRGRQPSRVRPHTACAPSGRDHAGCRPAFPGSSAAKRGRGARSDAARGKSCRRSPSGVQAAGSRSRIKHRSFAARASGRRSRCDRSPHRPPATVASSPIRMSCPAWKAIPPTGSPPTRPADSSSAPSPARARVLCRGASLERARRCRPAAPRQCAGQQPTPVFAPHTKSATRASRQCGSIQAPGVATRRSNCSAERRRPTGSSPTGTGPTR